MAEWPVLDELTRRLNYESDAYDDVLRDSLEKDLAAAIEKVKRDIGEWDEYEDTPDDMLSQAALRMAELIATRPEAQPGVLGTDPTYSRLMSGHRRRFGIA